MGCVFRIVQTKFPTQRGVTMKASSYKFPIEMLDLFPIMTADRKSVYAPPLPQTAVGTLLLREADAVDAREVLDPERLKSAASQCNYSTQQKDNSVWVNLRPRSWPSSASLRSCESWRIYAAARSKLMARKQERFQPR